MADDAVYGEVGGKVYKVVAGDVAILELADVGLVVGTGTVQCCSL